jgi:CelD/BcsL family acetyltransferase involved in cellulose biosynthesis
MIATLPRTATRHDGAGGPLTVHVESAASFARMRETWTALLRRSANPTPFLAWEWLHACWTHLSSRTTLALLTIRDGAELVAVAPLGRRRSHTLPYLDGFEWLGAGDAGSDYLDVLVDRDRVAETVDALAAAVDRCGLPLRLRHLPTPSIASELAQRLRRRGWSCRAASDGICPHVPLAGHTWDGWLGTIGPAHRANIRRRLRALAPRGLTFARVVTEDERREALAALARFHEERFGPDGSTALSTPALRAFHEDVTRRLMAAGMLWLQALRLDGRLAAVLYGLTLGNRVYFYQHGFDAAAARDSAGLVLMALSIRAALDEGASDFDLLYGTEPYKRLWARGERRLARLELFPPHLGGAVQHAATGIVALARGCGRRLLRRTHSC